MRLEDSTMAPKKKLAIIGASDFQNPLILAAKQRGLETHVFAWEAGDIGETTADFFHPISITDIEAITRECSSLGISGIASIGSDLANITVASVAKALGLTANTPECTAASTNKALMRKTFWANGDPSPKFIVVKDGRIPSAIGFNFPIIVKPSDRSGSRGITKLANAEKLDAAIQAAQNESFNGEVLIEEYIEGDEFSVEYISWQGRHRFLSVTEKFTSGAPHYIETAHLEPARISPSAEASIRTVVEHALDSLGVTNGASHSEVKVDKDGTVKIIEIGSRMGGDCIGSHLVCLSTGYDFVNAVIDVALGMEPLPQENPPQRAAAIRSPSDIEALQAIQHTESVTVDLVSKIDASHAAIIDSSSRHGFFVFSGDSLSKIEPFLPDKK